MASLRILIADDNYLVRRDLKLLVESHPGWKICAEASTAREAVSAAKELKPDIAILAMSMPEWNGLEATKRIRSASPNTEILIRSGHRSPPLVQEVLDAGARTCILDTDSDRDLVIAVETIANHQPRPTPLIQEAVDSPSAVASEDQIEIEAIRRNLEELIALVQQPLRQQLAAIEDGKPDDPTARDYIMEELFAIAVRSCAMDRRTSERTAHLCWEIFTYLAPSKCDGLTPTTMARLMSHMAKRVPQRYASELQSSSFLSVDLLSHSDRVLGTNHAEHLQDCLSRFSCLLLKDHRSPSAQEESESHGTAAVLKIVTVADSIPRVPEEPELHRKIGVLQVTQKLLEGDGLLTPEEHDVPPGLTNHSELPILVRIVEPIVDRVKIALRTLWCWISGIFSRTPRLLQNVKQWLNTPMKQIRRPRG